MTTNAVIIGCESFNNNRGRITVYEKPAQHNNYTLSIVADYQGPMNANYYGQNFEVLESPGQQGRQIFITDILNKGRLIRPIFCVLEVLILPDGEYYTSQRYYDLTE